jgi:serine/threonine protein kinase/Tfp pilus assembly protein PilF
VSLVGKTIGRILIVGSIGKGGMGEVYEGFDTTLERKVAVKAIGSKGRRDPVSKSRFLREARALSQLEHPHICLIYDYVEEKKNDFLVLEYIEGQNLRDSIKKGLDKTQKLRIAEQIAHVLKVAHEKGIVHRDLKPSNVMLTRDSGIKVLDFGLARFVESKFKTRREEELLEEAPLLSGLDRSSDEPEQTLTFKEELTEEEDEAGSEGSEDVTFKTRGGGILGTPLYMSPEQARGEPAGPASDMYSFGLLLQELFTEQSPYEETRDLATQIDKARGGETRPVSGLSSDLGTLINRLKSLAPAARPTAVETVERLKIIREKPKKRIRRLVAAGIITAFVVLGIKYALDLRRERTQAIQARDEATSVVEFLINLFEISDPGEARGNEITVREILTKGANEIEQGLEKQPLIRARMMETIGTVYRELGLYKEAEPLLAGALNICETELGSQHLRVAGSLLSLAFLYDDQGKLKEAEEFTRRSLEIREKALKPDHPDIAASLLEMGRLHFQNGKLNDAEILFKRSLEIREKAYGLEHPDVAESLLALGQIYYEQSRFDEAEGYYERALAIRESVLGSDHPDLAQTLSNLANLYYYQRKFEEAEELYRRSLAIREKTLGQVHPDVADSLDNIGILFHYQGNLDEAEKYYKKALEIRKQSLGENSPDVASSYDALARIYHSTGRYKEAADFYEKALGIMEKTLGPNHVSLPDIIDNLGLLYFLMERNDEAETLHKRGLKIREMVWGKEHVRVYKSLDHLGYLYMLTGRFDKAETHYRRALEILEKEEGRDRYLAQLLSDFGRSLTMQKKCEEAELILKRGLEICEKEKNVFTQIKAVSLANLAYLYHRCFERLDEAEKLYKEVLPLQESEFGRESEIMQETIKEYAELLSQLGRNEEALKIKSLLKKAP